MSVPVVQILQGDAREMLAGLPAEGVHCCICSPPYWGLRRYLRDDDPLKEREMGLEASLEEHIAALVAVFRAVRRVLRPEGTLWLNMGDSYATQPGKGANTPQTKHPTNSYPETAGHRNRLHPVLKPKDLIGMPWRLALALQADGWWLRSDIIWSKGNPMPSSVTDRPTPSHEYVFLLTKAAHYFYDADAIREKAVTPAGTRGAKGSRERHGTPGVNSRPPEYHTYTGTRNKRSVWCVNARGFPGSHFATFPPQLVEPMLLAGTSEAGCCAECGSPYKREVKASGGTIGTKDSAWHDHTDPLRRGHRGPGAAAYHTYRRETTGWSPTCACWPEASQPCTVLDPFAGSGTTGLVALQHNRKAILIELNPEYCTMIEKRLETVQPRLL